MNELLFQNRYRIPSTRATWHDYNNGTYFVTICTKQKKHYFGKIINGDDNHCKNAQYIGNCCRDDVHIVSTEQNKNNFKLTSHINAKPTMVLSPIGQYAHEQFRDVTKHYPYAEIPLWVVMPNHIHAVVMIDENTLTDNEIVDTMCISAPREQRWEHGTIDKKMQNISLQCGKLSTTIGGLKRAITHFANENALPFAWQPRFHDHIVRNTYEMNRIAEYIEQNVAKWASDNFFQVIQ